MTYGVTIYAQASPVAARSEEHLWRSIGFGADYPSVKATSGARVNSRTAMGYPPLWRAINLIANSVAGLPFDVYRRQRDGGKKADTRHPAQYLLTKKASEYMHAYTFRRTMTALALLHGNAYASIDRVEGRPVALAIWNPANTIVRVIDGEIYYITYFDNNPVRVPGRDMLHIRGLGPDGIVGYPLLELMAEALGVGMAAMEFGARFFGSGSNMSGLLMVPGHFSEEKIRNTMQAWDAMQSGLNRAHKVALLQDGVKFQQLQISPDQAQFLQTREHEVRATVANITGVPPHMLGDSTRTSHNSLEAEGQSYLDYSLQPWLKVWEAECNDKLLDERQKTNDTHFCEFNREALVQMSFETKVNGIYRQLEAGLITHNEGRALLNMPSLGEDGEARYRPANWMEIGSPEEEMAEGEDIEDAEDDSPDEEDDDMPEESPATAALRQVVTASITKAVTLEQSKALQLANRRAADFLNGVEEFYESWTANAVANLGLTASGAVDAIYKHANASKTALIELSGHCTAETLKAHVSELVATWDARRETLISSLLKTVQK